MAALRILRVQHVSVPRPKGSEEEARAFYGGVLGLLEIPVPESIRRQDLIWFDIGGQELHLFAEEPAGDTSRRHFCIEVSDLESVRGRLKQAGYRIEEATPIRNRPRFFCHDPFGNRIEFTTILGDYSQG